MQPTLRSMLVARDYQEIVSYSFVDESWEQRSRGKRAPVGAREPHREPDERDALDAWPGGSSTALAVQREPPAGAGAGVRGRALLPAGGGRRDTAQPMRVGGLAYGDAAPEQWGAQGRPVDFYDVKSGRRGAARRRARRSSGRVPIPRCTRARARASSAMASMTAGWIGELHPRWQQKYDLPLAPVLFELDYEAISGRGLPAYTEISKFPLVRRDIAAEVDEDVGYQAILEELRRRQRPRSSPK